MTRMTKTGNFSAHRKKIIEEKNHFGPLGPMYKFFRFKFCSFGERTFRNLFRYSVLTYTLKFTHGNYFAIHDGVEAIYYFIKRII